MVIHKEEEKEKKQQKIMFAISLGNIKKWMVIDSLIGRLGQQKTVSNKYGHSLVN